MVVISLKWEISPLNLILKYPWKISRNECESKQNLLIKLDGVSLGEVAPNTRFSETPESVVQSFNDIVDFLPKEKVNLNNFEKVLESFKVENSLKNGLYMAYYNFLNEEDNKSVETSYSIPILELGEYQTFFIQNELSRFKKIKLKVNDKNTIDRVNELRKFFNGDIFLDFNESLKSAPSEDFIQQLVDLGVSLLEQPFKSSEKHLYQELKSRCEVPIFLDESIESQTISEEYCELCHGVNLKLMKSGGLHIAKRQLKEAKDLGLSVMIGCMIESSLGISHAMELAEEADLFDLDGHLFLKNNPFSIVKEEKGILRRVRP